MKALSIRQPWAWAILHAGKRVENRTWRTDYRGPLLIHASAGMTLAECGDALHFIRRARDAASEPGVSVRWPGIDALLRGGVVGRANLVDCVAVSDSPWFMGPFGLVLADVEPLPFVPFKGRLGFFDVPDDALRAAGGGHG